MLANLIYEEVRSVLKNLQNESALDRSVRIILGLALFIFAYLFTADILQFSLYFVGAILIITGTSGVCLIYKLFGFSSINKGN